MTARQKGREGQCQLRAGALTATSRLQVERLVYGCTGELPRSSICWAPAATPSGCYGFRGAIPDLRVLGQRLSDLFGAQQRARQVETSVCKIGTLFGGAAQLGNRFGHAAHARERNAEGVVGIGGESALRTARSNVATAPEASGAPSPGRRG